MRKAKLLGVILASCAFMAFAVGSGESSSDGTNTETVKEESVKETEDIISDETDAVNVEENKEQEVVIDEATEEDVVEEVAEDNSRLAIPDSIPEACVYEGTGDSVINIDHPEGVYVIYVKGNSAARHFAVKGYDANGNSTELFVNTTDAYEGVTLDPDQKTEMLEISANGDWIVEIRSVWTCDIIDDASTYTGTGDNIVLVNYEASTAQIEGNSGARHFAVKSYGNRTNLMVNTTDVYSGTVMVKDQPFMLEITAVGDWSITLQ